MPSGLASPQLSLIVDSISPRIWTPQNVLSGINTFPSLAAINWARDPSLAIHKKPTGTRVWRVKLGIWNGAPSYSASTPAGVVIPVTGHRASQEKPRAAWLWKNRGHLVESSFDNVSYSQSPQRLVHTSAKWISRGYLSRGWERVERLCLWKQQRSIPSVCPLLPIVTGLRLPWFRRLL